MTDHRLRDLLEERVSDLEAADLSGPAWERARRRRHRRAAVVGAGAVAAVVAATAVVLLPGMGEDAPPPADRSPSVPSLSATAVPAGPVPRAVSAGEQHGASIWWAPDKEDEAALPPLAVDGVPEEVDLSAGARPHEPGVLANAVFMVGRGERLDGRVVILGSDGSTYALAVGRLEPVADEGGNSYPALGQESVSPAGDHVFFRQRSSLEVYDLGAGRWTTIELPDGRAERARWIAVENVTNPDEGPIDRIWVPDPTDPTGRAGTTYDADGRPRGTEWISAFAPWAAGGGDTYGPLRRDPVGIHLSGLGPAIAQAQFPDVELRGPGGSLASGVDTVATRDRSGQVSSVLALPYGQGGRWKACCPVVGWLGGPGTVLLESRGDVTRVLAWKVGTPELFGVTELTGWVPGEDLVVAGWAQLGPG